MQTTPVKSRRPMDNSTEAKPPVPKTAAKSLAVGRTDLLLFRWQDCVVDVGFNVRFDFGDVDAMADAFEATGGKSIPPLLGRVKDGKMHITGGETRWRAVRRIEERGGPSIPLPFRLEPAPGGRVSGLPDDRRIVAMLTDNAGRPLNQLEKGLAYKRLVGDHGYNMKQIGLEVGQSHTHVADCLLLVNDAAPALREAIMAGTLSATTAVELIKAEPDHDCQALILEQARTAAEGKRITARHIPVFIGKERHAAEREEPTDKETPTAEDPSQDGPTLFSDPTDSTPPVAAVPAVDSRPTAPDAPEKVYEPIRRLVDFASHEDAEAEVQDFGRPENLGPGRWRHEIVKHSDKRFDLVFRRLDPEADADSHQVDLPKSARINAHYTIASAHGRYYCGYEIASALVKSIRPSTSDQESFGTEKEAVLASLQGMLAFSLNRKPSREPPTGNSSPES